MPNTFLKELADWILLLWGIGAIGAVVWIALALAGPRANDWLSKRVFR